MPAAPDLLTLFGFEAQVEPVVVSLLSAVQIPAFRQQGASTLSTPRVEVKLHMGAPTGNRYAPPGAQQSPAQTYPQAFAAQLVLTVITNRTVLIDNADRHDEFVGKCRVLMLQAAGTLNAQLAYLSVRNLTDMGVLPEIRPDANLDVSPLLFALNFVVRPDAWPLEVTAPTSAP